MSAPASPGSDGPGSICSLLPLSELRGGGVLGEVFSLSLVSVLSKTCKPVTRNDPNPATGLLLGQSGLSYFPVVAKLMNGTAVLGTIGWVHCDRACCVLFQGASRFVREGSRHGFRGVCCVRFPN